MADWDERYRRGEHASAEPSRVLVRAVEYLRVGDGGGAGKGQSPRAPRALDLACGAGRHALFLAAHGFEVVAVDASRVGIGITRRRAAERRLSLDARVADLARGEFRIEPEEYDLVCDFCYLQRDLFPQMRAAVRAGGLVAATIHMVDERAEVVPMNPLFLLRPGELLAEFQGWGILHYHETDGHDDAAGRHLRRRAELIARRPA